MEYLPVKLRGKHGAGKTTLVSASDYPALSNARWYVDERGYAYRGVGRRRLKLHNVLLEPPAGHVVDHISGNTLDNRRENLRVVTVSENHRNIGAHRGAKSRFVGVWPSRSRWTAAASLYKKQVYLGQFDTEEEAARARDAFVRANGLPGRLNFPDVVPPECPAVPVGDLPAWYAERDREPARLTADQVREIRRRGATREKSQRALAAEYGCDQSTVSRIVNQKRCYQNA